MGTDQKGDSLYFNYLNRGKKSIILDITTAEGTEILEKLIPFYDVICVGAEAGYVESLGLGYGKPDIIYASYSYYEEQELTRISQSILLQHRQKVLPWI